MCWDMPIFWFFSQIIIFSHKVHTSRSIGNFSIEHTSVGLTHILPISYMLSPVSCKKARLAICSHQYTSVGLTHTLPISYMLSPVSCKKAVLRTFTCRAEEAWFTAATCRAVCTVQQWMRCCHGDEREKQTSSEF